MKLLRQIRASRLPIAGRAEQTVQDDERRMTGPAKIAMKELNHADTKYGAKTNFNSSKFLRALVSVAFDFGVYA